MLKQGSDFLFEIAIIRDKQSRINEFQLYMVKMQTTAYSLQLPLTSFQQLHLNGLYRFNNIPYTNTRHTWAISVESVCLNTLSE